MAILKNSIQFTGRLSDLSAYTMKGSDKIILRTKGGPTKKQIKKSPSFHNTRLHLQEFSGCSNGSKHIRMAIHPLKHLADYHFTGSLNALSRMIQKMDPVNKWGERSVLFSKHAQVLAGFQLNRQNPLDSVIRHPLHTTIDRATGTATVQIPELRQKLNLFLPWEAPCFRLIFSLGVVADRIYNGLDFKDVAGTKEFHTQSSRTPWQHIKQPFAATSITLQLDAPAALQDHHTLILSAGIEMGMPVSDGLINRVNHTGSAKIIAAG